MNYFYASVVFVDNNPYAPAYDKIFTLVRNDGVVVIDKVTPATDAYMVQIQQDNQTLTNVQVVRDNSGQNPPPVLIPSTVTPVSIFSTLKVFPANTF